MTKAQDRVEAAERARRALKDKLDIVGVPQTHLLAIVEAVLQDHFNEREVKAAEKRAAREAIDAEREKHETALTAVKAKHHNEIVDIQDRANDAYAEGVAAGKRRMYVKHAALVDAVEVLKDGRELLSVARAWSGPEEWRDEAVARFDELIDKIHPSTP